MKITWITTVLNENDSVERLFASILEQTLLPDEVVIVDGGSTDGSYEAFQKLASEHTDGPKFIISQKVGNRSVGRNEAIRLGTGEIIVCTDAGSFAEKRWVAEITKPFSDESVDVVAGYYEAKTDTLFQECLVPFVFVMPDKIRHSTFLPATRSMAFTRAIWEKAGKFPEQFSHNEDYVFARTLRDMDAKIVFHKEAIVYWIPLRTYSEAYRMFYRFAYGDAEAGITRPKVSMIFLRYFLGLCLFIATLVTQSVSLLIVSILLIALYTGWAVWKNYKYVEEANAATILAGLQYLSDLAVLWGTTRGRIHKIWGTKKTS